MVKDSEADFRELEQFREYLLLLARLQLDDRLQGKVDISGLVQQTLWEAYQSLSEFQSRSDENKAVWLRRILANNMIDEIRKLHTQARAASREQSLEAALDASSSRIEAWLAADESSPSQRAMRNERLLRLAEALARLPEEQRQAVEMHHLNGLSLSVLAEQMGRSKGAVAALLFRGLKRLRELLKDYGD